MARNVSSQQVPHRYDALASDTLLVVPSGKSLLENVKYGLYTEPANRPCKLRAGFIGLYHLKSIKYVGRVETIAEVEYEKGTPSTKGRFEDLTPAQRMRIDRMLEEPIFNFKANPHRFYMVDEFIQIEANKASPYGLQNIKYLDLTKILRDQNTNAKFDSKQLAVALNGTTWY